MSLVRFGSSQDLSSQRTTCTPCPYIDLIRKELSMRKPCVTGRFYEREFEDFEKNRRHPPDNKKGTPMSKISNEHLKVIDQLLISENLRRRRTSNQKSLDAIDYSVKLLLEIRAFLAHNVESPMFDHIDKSACELST